MTSDWASCMLRSCAAISAATTRSVHSSSGASLRKRSRKTSKAHRANSSMRFSKRTTRAKSQPDKSDGAMVRIPSHKRQELVEYATGGRSVEEQHNDFWGGQNIGFAHSIMMQCFMPHTRLPREEVQRGKEVFTRPQNEFSMTPRHGSPQHQSRRARRS